MKRFTIPRVAHCSDGCSLQSRARLETATVRRTPGSPLGVLLSHLPRRNCLPPARERCLPALHLKPAMRSDRTGARVRRSGVGDLDYPVTVFFLDHHCLRGVEAA